MLTLLHFHLAILGIILELLEARAAVGARAFEPIHFGRLELRRDCRMRVEMLDPRSRRAGSASLNVAGFPGIFDVD